VLHDSSRTGRQMPLVNVAGPQSQPKLHAALRIASKGMGYGRGRGPYSRLWALAYLMGLRNRTSSSLPPSRRMPVTSSRCPRCWLPTSARTVPLRRTVATVSIPSKTSSWCSAAARSSAVAPSVVS
jgi:hypothetical protein